MRKCAALPTLSCHSRLRHLRLRSSHTQSTRLGIRVGRVCLSDTLRYADGASISRQDRLSRAKHLNLARPKSTKRQPPRLLARFGSLDLTGRLLLFDKTPPYDCRLAKHFGLVSLMFLAKDGVDSNVESIGSANLRGTISKTVFSSQSTAPLHLYFKMLDDNSASRNSFIANTPGSARYHQASQA